MLISYHCAQWEYEARSRYRIWLGEYSSYVIGIMLYQTNFSYSLVGIVISLQPWVQSSDFYFRLI